MILIVLSIAVFMTSLDSSVVNVMNPRLQASLHLSATELPWVMDIYMLFIGGLLMLGGRLCDVLGRRRVFVFGMLLFAVSSLLVGASQNAFEVLSMRAVQGVSAAAMSPSALSILVTTFTDREERNKAFGLWGAVIGLGSALGTLVGGSIADWDWRWAFWINVPVGLATAAAALRWVPGGRPAGSRPRVDLTGAVTITAGMLSLVFGIIEVGARGWSNPIPLSAFAAGVVLLAGFATAELRSTAPLIPPALFRKHAVVAGALGEFLTGAVMMPCFFLLPIYMQDLHGYSPLKTALALQPVSVALIFFAPVLSRLIGKTGPRLPYLAGTAALAGMLAILVNLPLGHGYAEYLLPAISLLGIGIVLCLITTPVIGTSQATEEDAGGTSAILNICGQLGSAFGIALAVSVFNGRTGSLVASGASTAQAMDTGLRDAFAALSVLLALSILLGLFGFRGLGGHAAPAQRGESVSGLETATNLSGHS
ncbi:MAG TPA: MFS transporter [Actinocrinis sp.]